MSERQIFLSNSTYESGWTEEPSWSSTDLKILHTKVWRIDRCFLQNKFKRATPDVEKKYVNYKICFGKGTPIFPETKKWKNVFSQAKQK